MRSQRNYVFLGLSITSTWGNGHATTYRGLLKELAGRGHQVTFLERDVPWYASNREFEEAPYCKVELYRGLDDLTERFAPLVRAADAVVIGSYVPDGIAVGEWVTCIAKNVTAFYDIDTPVTLADLKRGSCEYLSRELIPKYHLYLSFTGGPTLDILERRLGSPRACPLYCSVDPKLYFPEPVKMRWNIGYLGTYAADRQLSLEKLLMEVARQNVRRTFAVAGPQYPETITWPENVERIQHLPAGLHREFYNSQAFTLNVTRRSMISAGYSPSVRLFEAAACGVPILTDEWPGLGKFFRPGSEILPVRTTADVTSYLEMSSDRRQQIGESARRRTLRFHTAAVRAQEFDEFIEASLDRVTCSRKRSSAVIQRSPTAALI